MSFLTTLASALKGGGPSRVPLARSFVSPWALAFEGGGRPAFDYSASLREGFVGNPVAQRAVRIVAEGVGSAPLADAEPELVALVTASSAGQSLVETVAGHLLLHGNAYVQVIKDGAGRPVELYALRPERVTVVPGADGWPAAYRYRLAERTLEIAIEDAAGSPGRGYLVGERGPELFVPTSAGRVEPGIAAPPRDVRVSIALNQPRGSSAPTALRRSSRQMASAVRRALAQN